MSIIYEQHKYAGTPEDAVADVLKAGKDGHLSSSSTIFYALLLASWFRLPHFLGIGVYILFVWFLMEQGDGKYFLMPDSDISC